ncbi:hypothetical protein [Aureispira sp. CCB-E]|uniref:hypothetical protein n=1 Tax=Aureispira sp. CCB-E TaxID=3051121 RepID=UPI00286953A4|nr:hypothetical protein [Aureispira sp. CCB-E]WMX12426.1 hypothetical protein QP953_16475 [Aureispira sp. CCB-E]
MSLINYTFNIGFIIPKDKLYDDDYLQFLNKKMKGRWWFNLYFITKIPKIKYKIEATKIIKNEFINFSFSYKGKTQSLSIEINKFIQKNATQWGNHIPNTFNHSNTVLKFLPKESTINELTFILSDGTQSIKLIQHIVEVANYLQLKPEVVYIGKSKKIIQRIRNHSTVQKIFIELEEDKEILFNFVYFYSSYGGSLHNFDPNLNMMSLNFSNPNILPDEYKTKYGLLERILINLFQPKYNTQHMKTELVKDELIKEKLLNNNIKWVAINLYSPKISLLNFWSSNQKNSSKTVSFNFDKPYLGFLDNYEAVKV